MISRVRPIRVRVRQLGRRAGAAALAVSVAGFLAACGAGSPPSSANGLVTAPALALQDCTYAPNNSIPAGEPHGLRPSFAPFSPDRSADAAIRSIENHGGNAIVDGTGIPSGAHLYSGPDPSATVVGTVPSGQSILLAEPLLWHEAGDTWMAFFLECGGPNLYWASLANIRSLSSQSANDLASLFSSLRGVPPYLRSHQASLEPVTVRNGHLSWTDGSITFPVGRGQLIAQIG